jgi:hypothetical protein
MRGYNPIMRRRFFSLGVRPSIYFALAGLLGLMVVLIDFAFIPSARYSAGYFRAVAIFGVPAVVSLYLGERSARRHVGGSDPAPGLIGRSPPISQA